MDHILYNTKNICTFKRIIFISILNCLLSGLKMVAVTKFYTNNLRQFINRFFVVNIIYCLSILSNLSPGKTISDL